MKEHFLSSKTLEEHRRALPHDIEAVDPDTDGCDGPFQLEAGVGESLSSSTSVLAIVGGGPGLDCSGKKGGLGGKDLPVPTAQGQPCKPWPPAKQGPLPATRHQSPSGSLTGTGRGRGTEKAQEHEGPHREAAGGKKRAEGEVSPFPSGLRVA